MIKMISLLSLFLLFSCGTTTQNIQRSDTHSYVGQTENGLAHGWGIQKQNDLLYVGYFFKNAKNGWFKVIYPDGSYGFTFFKGNRTSTHKSARQVLINSDFVGTGTAWSGEVTKFALLKYNHSNSFFYGELKNSNPTQGLYKDEFGFTKRGKFFGDIENGHFTIYGLNGGILFSRYDSEKGETLFSQYKSDGQMNGYFRNITKKSSNSEIKGWAPVDNILLPEFIGIKYSNGELYNGEAKNFVPNGRGYKKFKNGLEVWSWFKSGRPHGDAVERRPNGMVWSGTYNNGKRHGTFILAGEMKPVEVKITNNLNYLSNLDSQFKPILDWYYQNMNKDEPSSFGSDEKKRPLFDPAKGLQIKISNSISNESYTLNEGMSSKEENYVNKSPIGRNNTWALFNLTGPFRTGFRIPNYYDQNISIQKFKNGKKLSSVKNKKYLKCRHSFSKSLIHQKKKKHFHKKNDYYALDCYKGDLFNADRTIAISNANIRLGKIQKGKIHNYNFLANKAFSGNVLDNNKSGFGLDNSISRRANGTSYVGQFNKGKETGKGLVRGVSSGTYKNGLLNGKTKRHDGTYFFTGKFDFGNTVGTHKFTSHFLSTYGTHTYSKKKSKRLEFNSNGDIYSKTSFVNGYKTGSAVCRFKNESEPCFYKRSKRVDSTHLKRESERRKRHRALVAKIEKRKKLEKKKEEERIARQVQQRRDAAYKKRFNKNKSRYEDQARQRWWNDFKSQQKQNHSIYSKFIPAASSKPAPYNSTSPAYNSNINLKESNGSKMCEFVNHHDGKRFSTQYVCGDTGSKHRAEVELNRKLDVYKNSVSTLAKRKAENDRYSENQKQVKERRCQNHISRGGNACDLICVGTATRKNTSCKAGAN